MSGRALALVAALIAAGPARAEPQGQVMVRCWAAAEVQARLAALGEARIARPVGLDGRQYEVWGGAATGWTLVWVEPSSGMWCPLMTGPDLRVVLDLFGEGV